MKRFAYATALCLVSASSSQTMADSFSCSRISEPACINPVSSKVVSKSSTCFKSGTCRLDEFMCASDHEKYVRKASYIIDNHETFRACVVRSTMLDDIQDCLDAFDKRSLLTPE